MQTDDLRPEKVFRFFGEIAQIPHGSGHTEALADYCLRFAKERGLMSYRDDAGNVMIFKNATAGYEKSEPVILQGHLDMVCEKRPDCPKDMELEGVAVQTDGEWLYADGTTLGGDDGIAVAYILAILDDDWTISHPPIEALLTTDEEVGLRGAYALDPSRLKGRRLINIDSEEEGVLMVSCAGAVRVFANRSFSLQKPDPASCAKVVTVGGLSGGHSGIDIGKNRKNAAVVLASFLYEASRKLSLSVADISSGGRLNVIPPTAAALICVSDNAELDRLAAAFDGKLKAACADTEPEAFLSFEDAALPAKCLGKEDSDALISMLLLAPNGVSAVSAEIPFLVETSSNLGSVSLKEGGLSLGFMLRSNTDSGKAETMRRLSCLFGEDAITLDGDYPAWEYRRVSPLRDTMVATYEELYGEKPQVCAIHAGLECGILAQKLHGADMISIGPTMECVHTPDERLNIRSVQRCWEYLVRVLANLK